MDPNHTAAIFLKMALRKVFPEVENCQKKVDSQGFFCEFSYSQPFKKEYLPLLEKAMKDLKKQKTQTREMLAANAFEFFQHRKEKIAKEFQNSKEIIYVAEVGDFLDVCNQPLGNCPFFTLFRFEQKKDHVQIFGRAFTHFKEEKIFHKKLQKYPNKNHEYLAKNLDLYEGEMWHPRGVKLQHILKNFWKNWVENFGFEEVIPIEVEQYFAKTNRKKISYWEGLSDKNCFKEKKEISFYFDAIEKWLEQFELEYECFVVCSREKQGKEILQINRKIKIELHEKEKFPRIQWRIADALGRPSPGPFLEIQKEKVVFSLFGNLHHFIALLIERYEGNLPFWLCPEQVRLILLDGTKNEAMIEIFNRRKIRFFIDLEDTKIKEKVHRALQAKVPYVMVFGKREKSANKMRVRAYGSLKDQTMTLEQIDRFLAEQILESQ